MAKSTERLNKGDSNISLIHRNNLVLSIDKNEKIIKFNDKCEIVFGYTKDEVIDKKFLDFLIPDRYAAQWKTILSFLQKEKLIEDFNLPILTHNGYEIMISWSSFPIKMVEGAVGDISLVGTLINSWNDAEMPMVKSSKITPEVKIDSKKGEEDNEAISKLLKANDVLQKRNQKLESNIKALKSRRSKKHVDTSYSGKLVYYLADIVGGKKRRQEFERMMNELDDREKKLNKLGSQLLKDKKKANEIMNDCSTWRQKLEVLESEINKRNLDLEDRAKLLDSTIKLGESISLDSTISDESETNPNDKASVPIDDIIRTFDGISDSAAIIQRGILKQVNNSFVELIGYSANELVEKSFFDFIAPEGLSGVEQYYLDRLKGRSITDYETVFLTNDDQMIPIKVCIKPFTYNGEKVEIAIFSFPAVTSSKDIEDAPATEPSAEDSNEKTIGEKSEDLLETDAKTSENQTDISDKEDQIKKEEKN